MENKKVDAYELLTANSPRALAKEVNKKIAEGYRPLGGVVVSSSDTRALKTMPEVLYIQTMYKE